MAQYIRTVAFATLPPYYSTYYSTVGKLTKCTILYYLSLMFSFVLITYYLIIYCYNTGEREGMTRLSEPRKPN